LDDKTGEYVMPLQSLIQWRKEVESLADETTVYAEMKERIAALGETALLYELLKNEDGVVPVKAMLAFFFERLDTVETKQVTMVNWVKTLAYIRFRIQFTTI
jgi:hypothetical protein